MNDRHSFIFETKDGAFMRVTKRWLRKYAYHNFKDLEFNKILIKVINAVSERLKNTGDVVYENSTKG